MLDTGIGRGTVDCEKFCSVISNVIDLDEPRRLNKACILLFSSMVVRLIHVFYV